MNQTEPRPLRPQVQAVVADLTTYLKALDTGRYAITLGGSQGKGTWDERSDVDLRLFHEKDVPWRDTHPELWADYFAAIARWEEQGAVIDGIWPRTIAETEAALARWLAGDARPEDLVWTVWGYHLPPDLYHMAIVEDPYGIVADWKRRLAVYPPALKAALLDRHTAVLRYWRTDYHYRNKVARRDAVFLAGLTSKLVHHLLQVLFALNETYYVGDGQNLDFARRLALQPPDLAARVEAALYPPPGADRYRAQYDALTALVDDVLALAGPLR